MNIVCLSTLGVGPGFIIRQTRAAFPEMKVVRVRFLPKRPSPIRRLKNLLTGRWLRRIEHRFFYRRYFDRASRRLEQLLYRDEPPAALPILAEVTSREINQPSTAEFLASLDPDLLLVVGCPVLKPRIFGIPRLAAMNVHFGVTPYYRGEETIFWPLYYRDYHRLGVTIHQIDQGIDTGAVLAQGIVDLSPADDEWTVEAKISRLAAELVVDLLGTGKFAAVGRPHAADAGREFRFSQRRVWHDALYAARRKYLGERPPQTERRVVNYVNESQAL